MKQLIVSVHGIRTFGAWQERLERLLSDRSSDRELTVINYKYGYLSIIAFIIPFMHWLAVIGSYDKTARVLEVYSNTQMLLDRVKTIVPRCLTEDQRKAFLLDTAPLRWCVTALAMSTKKTPRNGWANGPMKRKNGRTGS
jgi:hypothetical protein